MVTRRLGLLILACTAVAAAPDWPELLDYDPMADNSAIVLAQNTRFTVLTSRLIRIEQAENGKFEDRATTAIVNRKLPVPAFSVDHSTPGTVQINTDAVELTYTPGGSLSGANLKVKPRANNTDGFVGWEFGQKDTGNLLGTIKSLDQLNPTPLNCTENKHIVVHGEDLHCAWGLISRSGWAVLDDSDTYALDGSGWWDGQNTDGTDIYLFAHGMDYRGALADFVKIGGRVALPPRAALGVWWTRWFNYNAAEVREIVNEYRSRSLPLDVFVLDMDWHVKPAWGSYSWDRNLFPYPSENIGEYLKQTEGLITLANLHDDNGVVASEDQHAAMLEMMNLPASTGDVPFEICNNTAYAQALEDAVLMPLEKDGLDYWWIDWQQGGNHGGCAGLKQNPTIWTNKLRATDHIRRSPTATAKRGLVLARWGGVGSHRYQVGFSGDVKTVNWENLAYQPYFSQTSTNVAYGFWSHDIVGPSGTNIDDLELYTRWLQWATYSGIFRSHDRGSSAGGCAGTWPETLDSNKCTVVKPWNVPTRFFEANRAALQRRSALVPYTYSAARAAYDTGVGPLIPMYYNYPHLDAAYAAQMDGSRNQYFFGDDLIVSPVVQPASNSTAYLVTKELWVPPGLWYDEVFGSMLQGSSDGSTYINRSYDLGDIPVLVRAGAIIPTLPMKVGDTIATAARQYTALILSVYPGSHGIAHIYEDDGATDAYARGTTPMSSTTTVSHVRNQDASRAHIQLNVSTAGSYPEQPRQRMLELHLVSFGVVSSVTIDGKAAQFEFSRYGSDRVQTWSIDGASCTTVLRLPAHAVANDLAIEVDGSPGSCANIPGVKGMMSRGRLAKAALDEVRTTPGAHESGKGKLDRLAVAQEEFARGPDAVKVGAMAGQAWSTFTDAIDEVNNMTQTDSRMTYVRGLLMSAQ